MAILHLHFYANTSVHYSPDKFADYLRGPIDAAHPFDRFDDAGVSLDFRSTAAHGTADFKSSLRDDGSVVVYLGHSVPDHRTKRSLGLSFLGNGKADIPAITVAKPGQPKPPDLMDLVGGSRAKLVILATCASSTFGLEKLKAGPAVVVTNSGVNLVTWSANWGIALQHFLLLLIGYEIDGAGQPVARKKGRATISEALEAANAAFKKFSTTDRCELAHGEGSMVVFPEKK
jgi:hypothetical protein